MRVLSKSGGVIVAIGQVLFLGACATPPAPTQSEALGDADAPPPPADYDGSIPAGREEDITIEPNASATLDLGDVRCGGSLEEGKAITISNNGDVAVSFEAKLGDASQLRLSGITKGSIAPHTKATVSVNVTPNVVGPIEGSVIVTAGKAFQEVHATAVGRGAVLAMAPGMASFGEVKDQSGGAPLPIEITNSGNDDVVIGSFSGAANDLDLTWEGKPQSFLVKAGTTATVTATFAPGTKQADFVEANFAPVVTGALCADVAPLTLRGKRVDTSVTLTPVDFGKQSCNAPSPTARDITITNFAPAAIDYTITPLPETSYFTITNAGPGSVTANQGTAKISVGVKAIGALPKVFAEDLTVTVTGQSGGAKTVKMQADIRGAVVTVTPVKIESFYSNGYNTDYESFNIKNDGNEAIGLAYGFNRTEGGTAWIHPDDGTVKAAATSKLTIGFRPNQTNGWHQADFPVSRKSGATLCNQPELPVGRGYRPSQ